jgi:hypothetical protein
VKWSVKKSEYLKIIFALARKCRTKQDNSQGCASSLPVFIKVDAILSKIA